MLSLKTSPLGLSGLNIHFLPLAHVFVAFVGVILFLALQVVKPCAKKQCWEDVSHSISPIDKTLILPGRISHTRLFPKHHSFSYSYLMVGIPIHSTIQNNRLVSVDERVWWKRGWLCVNANDHLGRGENAQGIQQKLRQYLESKVRDTRTLRFILEDCVARSRGE